VGRCGLELPCYWGWYLGRNYQLFGALAGVRRQPEERMGDPRGLPADVSVAVADRYPDEKMQEACLYHSTSYWTLRELLEFDPPPWWQDRRLGPMKALLRHLCGLGGADDVRIVFWFDN